LKLAPRRGAKFGFFSGLSFAVVTPINNWLQDEPISGESILVGSIFAFCMFGIIGTLTDKIGSEIGD
jgi:hypothetical protein